jgi:hypothetical protein
MEEAIDSVLVFILPLAPLMLCVMALAFKEALREPERGNVKINKKTVFSMELSKRKVLNDWLLEEIAKTKIKMHLCGDPGLEAKINELTQINKENSDRMSEIEKGLSDVSKEDEVNELLNRLLHLSDFDESERSGSPSV